MSVEESIVIFGPICQVGWASASATVTAASSAAVQPRNGPPLAVRRSRATSTGASGAPAPSAGRERPLAAFAEALVDRAVLGVDRDESPPRALARATWTTGAPAMSDSLLARASRRPERSAATVTASPANPTTAFSTTSPISPSEARPSVPARTSTPGGTAAASSGASEASPMATTCGWRAAAWRASSPTERFAPSATTR